MNNKIPPNIDANLFTLSSVIIGEILTGDFNVYELNAIGNWLIMVGQYLLTTASQQQVLNNRNNSQNDLTSINKALNIINEQLEKMKKN